MARYFAPAEKIEITPNSETPGLWHAWTHWKGPREMGLDEYD